MKYSTTAQRTLPRVQSVKRSPEKHIAAMAMKKMNSDIMARKALFRTIRSAEFEYLMTYRTTMLFEMAKNASLK